MMVLFCQVCVCVFFTCQFDSWIWAVAAATTATLIILTSVSDPLQIKCGISVPRMCHSLLDKPVEFVNDLISQW